MNRFLKTLLKLLLILPNALTMNERPANPNEDCVIVRFFVNCPKATAVFRARIQIWRPASGRGRRIVAEQLLTSSWDIPRTALATLRGCAPHMTNDQPFFYLMPEQTCMPNVGESLTHIIAHKGGVREYTVIWTMGVIEQAYLTEVPDATPTNDWRSVCALVHLNLSCPHPFRAVAFLWEQTDENEPNVIQHTQLGSSDRWATLFGCSPLVPMSRLPDRTTFSVTVPEQDCVADWKSYKERWLVGSQRSNQTYQTYDMRLKLTPHSKAEVEVKTADTEAQFMSALSLQADVDIEADIDLTVSDQ